MNRVIKNNLNMILSIFILLHPIIDLITGVCLHVFNINLTLGNIVRILFLLFIMYTTIFTYQKKKSFIYYLIFGIYSVLYFINCITFKNGVGLFTEIQGLIRTFYFPIILLSLYELKDEIKVSKMVLVTTLGIYLLCIFFPIMFGVGYQSYQITKSGTLGFYNSANEISGIISILTPITLLMFMKDKKNSIIKLLFSLIYLVVIFTVGTKTPLLSLFITIGMIFLWILKSCIEKKKYKPVIYCGIGLVIGITSLIIIIPQTNFYKNIKVHLDYLKVDSIVDIVKDDELIDHFIFSQRLTFWDNREEDFEDVNVYQKLTGIGYLENGKNSKLIEMDYIDVYYNHGILGFIIFFGAYFYVLVKVFKERQKLTFDRYMMLISFVLIIFLSLFTGHIITAPAVSLITIIIILSLDNSNKKNLLFAVNNLCMGGIEKSIINLLNNIDYNKYNVTLVMEKKEGVLLSKVNKNVKIIEVKVSNNKNVFVRKAINLSRKLKFYIFNYHNYDFSCCYATYSLSANVLSKIASSNNSLYVHSNYKNLYNKEEFIEFFDTRKINEFRRIIFVSNEAKDDFKEIYKEYEDKLLVFNNFVDYEEIVSLSKEKIAEKKPKNQSLFVFVGRLDDSSKKLSRAIKLAKEIKDIDLWIIGDGPDRKMYEELIELNKVNDRVTLFGSKTNPYPYMSLADYIILTSEYEGFPVTYLEAIILGKPIVTTIDVSDDKINIGKDYGMIISKEEKKMVKEVKEILNKNIKTKKLNFEKLQQERMKKLEELFDNTI